MNKNHLQRQLNDFVGEGYGYIPRWALRLYGKSEWNDIRAVLQEWESKGWLTVQKDPEHCDDNELCLKMMNFIEGTEPLPSHWINYEKTPPKWTKSK